MMISQPALFCLSATWQRLIGRIVNDVEPISDPMTITLSEVAPVIFTTVPAFSSNAGSAPAEGARPVPVAPERDEAVVDDIVPTGPLSANERRARAAALRALALSRGRRFDAAGAAFAEAARLDPLLDLTRTPAFWKLERAAHEAAIDAYVHAGREGDAAVLRARVQSTFRPKPLRSRQQIVVSP
jgi:hypothetical protein